MKETFSLMNWKKKWEVFHGQVLYQGIFAGWTPARGVAADSVFPSRHVIN